MRLDMDSLRIALFTDASFANGKGHKSHLGFLIALKDNEKRANIVHYRPGRCQLVTRSVMASEVHSMFAWFHTSFTVEHMLEEITWEMVPIEAYMDLRILFEVIAK